ncbi:MAG TPA: PDZ domain-containing protein, partial [Longimicrobium sp.]
MTNWTTRAQVVAALLAAAPAMAQAGRCGPDEMVVADLGFDNLSCAGCSFRMDATDPRRMQMRFDGGEPRIGGVRADGPANGQLRNGDALVAVGGALITTEEGGRRYTAIDPGDRVRLSVRRDGQVRQVDVV